MLDGLVNVFADFGLNINWKPGKTECMIRLRGRLLCTAQVPAVECADQQQVADLRSCCVSQDFLHSAPPKCLHESAAPHAWRIVI